MSNQLLVVLARLLNLERENDRLLAPVGSLHEVVDLQTTRHLTVRVADEEVLGLVPPSGQVAHADLRSTPMPACTHDSSNAHDTKVEDGVALCDCQHVVAALRDLRSVKRGTLAGRMFSRLAIGRRM